MSIYYFFNTTKKRFLNTKGFVLPFTLFICAIMLLISTSVSSILQKQIYFSQIARESQAAYYAADDAVACVLSIEEIYTDSNGSGIFPYNPTDDLSTVQATIDYTNLGRSSQVPPLFPLAATINDIKCSQSTMFNTLALGNNFTLTSFSRQVEDPTNPPAMMTENGKTSTFSMKMALDDGTYRCAKVTVEKTPSYRKIIAQGYSRCDRLNGAVERAVIDRPEN
jgi:hypothetical protein